MRRTKSIVASIVRRRANRDGYQWHHGLAPMDPRSVPIGTPLWFRQQISAGPFCPVPGSLLFLIWRKFTVSLNTDFVWDKLSLSRLRLFAKDVYVGGRYLNTRFIRDSKSLILYIYEIYGTGINAPSGCGYASRVHPCTLVPDKTPSSKNL